MGVLLRLVFGLVLSYAAFLWLTFQYPAWAPTPDLAQGVVILGHATHQHQVLWVHCNVACRWSHSARVVKKGVDAAYPVVVRYRELADPAAPVRRCDSSVAQVSSAQCGVTVVTRSTTVLTLTGLRPCTIYAYAVDLGDAPAPGTEAALNSSRYFTTPPTDEADGCSPESRHIIDSSTASGATAIPVVSSSSTLALDEPEAAVVFHWGSCLGISPFSDIRAFRWLFQRPAPARSDLVLLLGDLVYTDIPAVEDYTAYSQVWGDRAFQDLFGRVPSFNSYDDHEIVNDWSVADGPERFDQAMLFFDEFSGSKNPPPPARPFAATGATSSPSITDSSSQVASPKRRYFNFRRGAHAAFFVLDTRQYASAVLRGSNATDAAYHDPSRTKLGHEQLAHLLQWLRTETATFKFIASSVAWSSTAFKFTQDAWAAYRYERDAIFDFIAEHNVTGVVLLSADLHWAGVFHFTKWNLREVTVSPIQSFPLPHWIESSEDELVQFSSKMWWMHIGEVAVHAPTALTLPPPHRSPRVDVTIYRYLYDTPKPAHELTWTLQDLVPRQRNQTREEREERAAFWQRVHDEHLV